MISVRIAVAAALFAPFALAGFAQVPNTPAPRPAEPLLPGISKYRS